MMRIDLVGQVWAGACAWAPAVIAAAVANAAHHITMSRLRMFAPVVGFSLRPYGQGHRIWRAVSSPSPRLRGEGRDEGALHTVRTRGESPHPDPLPVRTGRGRR